MTTSNEEKQTVAPFEFNAEVTYSPLLLQFNGGWDSSQHWALRFQQFPTSEIILTGDYPTRDEIIQCLLQMQAPVWMIGVCEVAAAVAKRYP